MLLFSKRNAIKLPSHSLQFSVKQFERIEGNCTINTTEASNMLILIITFNFSNLMYIQLWRREQQGPTHTLNILCMNAYLCSLWLSIAHEYTYTDTYIHMDSYARPFIWTCGVLCACGCVCVHICMAWLFDVLRRLL